MSTAASADELELKIEDDDGNFESVFCKVENVVSARHILKRSNNTRLLTYLPAVLAVIALLALGEWLLAIPVGILGYVAGNFSVHSFQNQLQGQFSDREVGPWGVDRIPVDVTTLSDHQRADLVDLDDLRYKLQSRGIEFQDYSGTFESTYYETGYEYVIVTDHVTDATVDPGSVRDTRRYMFALAGVFAVGLFIITTDFVTAAVPALLFAAGSYLLDPVELPAIVSLEVPGDEDESIDSVVPDERTSFRRLLLPTEDAHRVAEAIRSGESVSLDSEGGELGIDEDDPRPGQEGFTTAEAFEDALDDLVAELDATDSIERRTAARALRDGARKYPSTAYTVLDDLVAALEHDDTQIRRTAAETITVLADVTDQGTKADAERVVSALVPHLEDADDQTRNKAARALAEWSSVAPEAVRDQLETILGAGTAPIQVAEDPEDAGLLGAFASRLRAGDEEVLLKRALQDVLVAVAETDPEGVATDVCEYLERGPPPIVTSVGLQVLAGIADDHPEAVPLPEHIEEYLANDDTRFDALYLLSQIASERPEDIEPLARNVNALLQTRDIEHDSPMDNLTANAILTLTGLAEYDPSLVTDPKTWLPETLTHRTPLVRYASCRILAILGRDAVPADVEVSNILKRLLTDENHVVREGACEAVAGLGVTGLEDELDRCIEDQVPGAEEARRTISAQ